MDRPPGRDRLAFPTRAVHAGEQSPLARRRAAGGVVFLTAPFLFDTEAELEEAFASGGRDSLYSRQGNPTVRVVEDKLAALEGAADAVAFSSGLAAITGTLGALLASGDLLLVARELYGGTAAWLRALERRHPEIAVESVALALGA